MRLSQVVIFGLALAVAGCAGNDSGIRILSSNGEGPDEFRIVPSKGRSSKAGFKKERAGFSSRKMDVPPFGLKVPYVQSLQWCGGLRRSRRR